MAQWLGQFSGHTHATRVQDAEAALRQAVTAFRAAGSDKARQIKAKAVRRLAKRLLSARLRLLKARLVAAEPVADEETNSRGSGIETLRRRAAKKRDEGVNGILVEFAAEDALG